MNALACLLLTAMCVGCVIPVPVSVPVAVDPNPVHVHVPVLTSSSYEPVVDINATSVSRAQGAEDSNSNSNVDNAFLLKPEPVIDGKPHHLHVGECNNTDQLLHTESIVVNNDGTSRLAGDVRVNVEAPVNITCLKVLDQRGNASGAFPSFVDGGVGHNYVVFGFDAAHGYGLDFLIQVYGHDLAQSREPG